MLNLKQIRNYRRRLKKTNGLIKNNPVVSLGMALPFVIVPTQNLKSSLLISLFIFAATVLPAAISPLLHKKMPMAYLVPCCMFLAMSGVIATQLMLRRQAALLDNLGLYIPLAALNGIMFDIAIARPRQNPLYGLKDAIIFCSGFALVAAGIGAVREILAARTVWGIPFGLYPISINGVALPLFGFIILGFLNALCRSADRKALSFMLLRASLPEKKEDADA